MDADICIKPHLFTVSPHARVPCVEIHLANVVLVRHGPAPLAFLHLVELVALGRHPRHGWLRGADAVSARHGAHGAC